MFERIKLFKEKGHLPTLIVSFVYFDFSFMVWTIFAPVISDISATLGGLSFLKKAFLLAVPIFSGAVMRILFGFLVDYLGAKKSALLIQAIVTLSLWFICLKGYEITYEELLIASFFFGFSGASFAIVLPQVAQWYPAYLQGSVLGIVAAGSFGVVLDYLIAPKISFYYGWPKVFFIAAVFSTLLWGAYIVFVKDALNVKKIRKRKIKNYFEALKDKDVYWFMLFYAISFGGFVGLASYMKIYLSDLLPNGDTNGLFDYLSALAVFVGAVFRPVGGILADKIGGVKSLYFFYFLAFVLSVLNVFSSVCIINVLDVFLLMACLGAASGAVFQLVPQRFKKELGIVTGLIGSAGALGGGLFIEILALSKNLTGTYSSGFVIFAIIVLHAVFGLSFVKVRWRKTWGVYAGGKI
jgi:NNP family nitrate/nitrite transporter-like MFS transporter